MQNIENVITRMRVSFEKRLSNSLDKKTLIASEIEAHETLFDETKLRLPKEIHSNRRPISGLKYSDGDILQIREAYTKFIVNGADINDEGDYYYVRKESIQEGDIFVIDNKGRYCKKMPPSEIAMHYYKEAMLRYQYLQWLKGFLAPVKRTKRDPVSTLQEACKSDKSYETLKAWFIEKKFCDPVTFAWNKNYTLSTLAGYLKALNTQGHTIKITQAEMLKIAHNSFNAELGIDTIKQAKAISGIPPA